jgi:hypothetical protein
VQLLPLLRLAPWVPEEFRPSLDGFRGHYSVPNSLTYFQGLGCYKKCGSNNAPVGAECLDLSSSGAQGAPAKAAATESRLW